MGNKQAKTRLCWNCEGNVLISQEVCPFCGVSVVPASLDERSSFAPSYRISGHSDSAVPDSSYAMHLDSTKGANEGPSEREDDIETTAAYHDFKQMLMAAIALLSGSIFLLFSLVLLLFSSQGTLTLQWDATLWFVYGGFALLLLFFGWRKLRNIEG